MALATSVKKLTNSIGVKILCVLLSVITFFSATAGALFVYELSEYNRIFPEGEFYSSGKIGDILSECIYDASYNLKTEKKNFEIREEIEAKREEIVNDVFKKYTNSFDRLAELYENGFEFDVDSDEPYYENPDDPDEITPLTLQYSVELSEAIVPEVFQINVYLIYQEIVDNLEKSPSMEDVVKKEITVKFDEFEDNCISKYSSFASSYAEDNYDLSYIHLNSSYLGETYAIKYEDDSYEDVLMQEKINTEMLKKRLGDAYVVIKDGKIYFGDLINGDARDGITADFNNTVKDLKGLSLVLTVDDEQLKQDTSKSLLELILDGRLMFDGRRMTSLRFLYDFGQKAGGFKDNSLAGECVGIVVLYALSFVLAGIYYAIAGKRNNGECKVILIDKIPVVIHTLLSALVGVLLVIFTVELGSRAIYTFSPEFILAAFAIVCGLALIAFELTTSLVRCKRAGRLTKDYLLTTQICRLVKKSSGPVKKGISKLKTTLSYAPKTFKRNVILLSVIYLVATIASIVLILIFTWAFFPLAILIAAGWIAGSIVILCKVCDFYKQLDMVIIAAATHTPMPPVTYPSLYGIVQGFNSNEQQLQQAVAQAVKDERLRSELITNVSHDLKTPLTSIINYVNLLKDCDIQDETARKYIEVLDEKGIRLKRLIEDLIEASKVTSGNIVIEPAPINFYELCVQATGEVNEDFEKAGLSLVVKECENAPVIFADGVKTFRVIENLLSNARKYSAVGSRVYVEVKTEGNMGLFEIKNISAQPLDIDPQELTERFVRGDKSRNQEGNGLGLSIAKELCLAQGGSLNLIIDGDLFKAQVRLPIKL